MPAWMRVFIMSALLAGALLLSLLFWHLPHFLLLDRYRPHVIDLLEKSFGCHVQMGGITGELFPFPKLVIQDVVFLEATDPSRVLASLRALHLRLSVRSVARGRLRFRAIQFENPRILLHHEKEADPVRRWRTLQFPAPSSQPAADLGAWDIRHGSLEIWDHVTKPTSKWAAEKLSGSYDPLHKIGRWRGLAPGLGPHAKLALNYDAARQFPFSARLEDVHLGLLSQLFPFSRIQWDGTADIDLKGRFEPALRIQATARTVPLPPFDGVRITGEASYTQRRLAALLQSDTASPVKLGLDVSFEEDMVKTQAELSGYDSGRIRVRFDRPRKPLLQDPQAALSVQASSVTVRQVLQIFGIESSTPAAVNETAPLAINPVGYEHWRINEGEMQATFQDNAMDIMDCRILFIDGMALALRGRMDWSAFGSSGSVQGTLQNIRLEPLVESFFAPPSPITGIGQADFNLTFPLTARWVEGLNGAIIVLASDGVLRAFKGMYRVVSVLNLGNYLRLRFPQVSARGIQFRRVSGRLTFQQGMLATEDLFLKSPNMNLGASGTLDIPGRSIDVKLRIEMFRFLEDILKAVPITNWIFRKPSKIFLPLLVRISGPWDSVEIR